MAKGFSSCVVAVSALLALACGADSGGGAPCGTDTDCKGDRVCIDGSCQNPIGSGQQPSSLIRQYCSLEHACFSSSTAQCEAAWTEAMGATTCTSQARSAWENVLRCLVDAGTCWAPEGGSCGANDAKDKFDACHP